MNSPRDLHSRSNALVETLEARQLMSITLSGGMLTVQGDQDSDNRISVKADRRAPSRLVLAAVNGERRRFARVELTGITVVGGEATDVVVMGAALRVPITVFAKGGNDKLTGGSGHDTLLGGTGNDVIRGGDGDDYIHGGEGVNSLIGGRGTNRIFQGIENPTGDAPLPVVQSPANRQTAIQRPDGTTLNFGVNVTLFRNADGSLVLPNDGIDDTVGLQRAIDSVDPFWGFPMGTTSMGGTIYLPAGEYQTSAPLRVPGNIILSGDGDDTVINYTGATGSAIELIEVKDANFVSAAGAQNLTIKADMAGGVGVYASRLLYILQMRFRDITLDTAGWGINFAGHQTQNSFFENVTQKNIGAGALQIAGNANKITGIKVVGAARDGHRGDPAAIVVRGDGNRIADSVVGPLPAGWGSAFYISGYYPSMSNNRAEVASGATSLANDVAFTFDVVEGGTVDDLWGRKAQFIDVQALQVGRQWYGADVTDLYQLIQLDDKSRILIDEVSGPGIAGGRAVALPAPPAHRVRVGSWTEMSRDAYFNRAPTRGGLQVNMPSLVVGGTAYGVNARDFHSNTGFRVAGNNTRDETTGIQAAIDAVARPRPTPDGGTAVGGVVYLPAGDYRTFGPLYLPDGVVLVGDGSATVIRYEGVSGPAVQFRGAGGALKVTGAGVENLCISADRAGAIGAPAGMTVDRARVQDVVITSKGWGIDLRNAHTTNSAFDNVHQRGLGSGSVWVAGDSNRFYAINTEFGIREGFVADPALLVVKGNNNSILGSVIEGVPSKSASAIYVSGMGLTWGYNWAEISHTGYTDAKNGDAFIFEDVRNVAFIDNLHILSSSHRARLINSQITVQQLNNVSENYPLRDYVALDSTSSLRVTWVIARYWGTGSLEGSGITLDNLFKKDEPIE